MIDKNSIIKILSQHPNGMKAKDIASHILEADRKSINQILYANPSVFEVDNNYEWKLKSGRSTTTKTSTPRVSEQEIQKLFKNVKMSAADVAMLRELDASELKTINERFSLLCLHLDFSWDKEEYFTIILKKVLFQSEKTFSQILAKTRKIQKYRYINNCYLWEAVVLSPNFETICLNAQELKKHQETNYVTTEKWLEIVLMSPAKFKEFMDNIHTLSTIAKTLYSGDLISLAIRKDFQDIYKRIIKIREMQNEGLFPALKEIGYYWKELITFDEKRFERCLKHSRKICKSEPQIINQIIVQDDEYKSRFLHVIKLSDYDVSKICNNLSCFTSLPIKTQLEDKDWFAFFLQSKKDFEFSWENSKLLTNAVMEGKIPLLEVEEWKSYIQLTPRYFGWKLEQQKEQYAAYLKEKEEKEKRAQEKEELQKRVLKEMNATRNSRKDKPIKQCFGDCGICKRDKCVLDD